MKRSHFFQGWHGIITAGAGVSELNDSFDIELFSTDKNLVYINGFQWVASYLDLSAGIAYEKTEQVQITVNNIVTLRETALPAPRFISQMVIYGGTQLHGRQIPVRVITDALQIEVQFFNGDAPGGLIEAGDVLDVKVFIEFEGE